MQREALEKRLKEMCAILKEDRARSHVFAKVIQAKLGGLHVPPENKDQCIALAGWQSGRIENMPSLEIGDKIGRILHRLCLNIVEEEEIKGKILSSENFKRKLERRINGLAFDKAQAIMRFERR
jgi:hypothetical protein